MSSGSDPDIATLSRTMDTPVGPAPRLPLLRALGDVLGYLAHRDSLLALSVLAVILSVTEWVAGMPTALAILGFPAARVLWACYFFLAARKAALGSRRLPIPSDHLDTYDTLLQPLLQGMVATAPSWGALLVRAGIGTGLGDFLSRHQGRPLQFLADQGLTGYVLLALWVVQVPIGAVAALSCHRVLQCADPTVGVRLLRRTGLAYPILFVTLCVLALIGHAVDIGASRLGAVFPVPLAGPVLLHFIQMWLPLAQARLLGDFVHRYRPWLDPELPVPITPAKVSPVASSRSS